MKKEARQIRNFSIIAHIDHGKSTLADRLLELTKTIPARKMRAQVLDSMELERERGITIKMQPVRMSYELSGQTYELNLIDTPGHIDFSYEVSRALRAVEGVILLVDATKSVQAQTISVVEMARALNLPIIPVINKIDLPAAQTEETRQELMTFLNCPSTEILNVSAKTGLGVDVLLKRVIERLPPPPITRTRPDEARALVFDFSFSSHRGLVVYARLFDGEVRRGDRLRLAAGGEEFVVHELGCFNPEPRPLERLEAGEIGYLITGIKVPRSAKVGDTLLSPSSRLEPVPGYHEPRPVVFASLYPESQDDFVLLRQSLATLQLSDAALSYSEEFSSALGRGFQCGFLGLLHLEIVTERLKREFGLEIVMTTPSIRYEVYDRARDERLFVASPPLFPENLKNQEVSEPWIAATIIAPAEYLGGLMKIIYDHEAIVRETNTLGDRTRLIVEMPLREMMRRFFEELKSVSSGFASFSYQPLDYRPASVARLDVLVAEEPVFPLSRIVGRRRLEEEAKALVERLRELLPRQLFVLKIQARADGRIVASRSVAALRKDVTGYLYGGDITRKQKLWAKQKRGKKRLQERGRVAIPPSVYLKLLGGEK